MVSRILSKYTEKLSRVTSDQLFMDVNTNTVENTAVHSIPCTVVVPDGVTPAKVKSFFEPLIRELPTSLKNGDTCKYSKTESRCGSNLGI